MKTDPQNKELVETGKTALAALRRAAASARKLSRQTKTPFIIWRDGKIVDLNAPRPPKQKK